jgi:membrane protease YdiL (CAAX protease family)
MPNESAVHRYIAVYPFALFAAWIVAWAINLTLRAHLGWTVQADTIYWIVLKLIVWILPVLLAIQLLEGVPVSAFLELRNLERGLVWGLGTGSVLVAVNYLGKTLPSGTTLHRPPLDLVFVNAVVVAPLVEEITLRGFLLKRLELNGHAFWRANMLTAVVFVAMHLPGWLFQGRGLTLASFAERALPLAALSLLFGWTKKRSGSLYAAILLHAINNLYSTLFP